MEQNGSTAQRRHSMGKDEGNTYQLVVDDPENPKVKVTALTCKQRILKGLKDNLLMVLSLVGVVIGFVVGFSVRPYHPSEDAIMWIGLPGELFLSILKMTIVPVIVSSVISATAGMDAKGNGKLGGVLMIYLILTNLIGSGIGVAMGLAMKLGSPKSDDASSASTEVSSTSLKTTDILADLLRNLLPSNLIRATMQKAQTYYSDDEKVVLLNTTNGLKNITVTELTRSVGYVDSVNVMGIVFASMVFGVASSRMREKSKPFVDFFNATTEIILLILQWFLWAAPLGVLSLIAASVANIEDLAKTFSQLGLFVAVVAAGLTFQQLALFPGIYFFFTRTNPFRAMFKSIKAWFIGFASASSACTMPYMFDICESLGFDRRVYKLGIPLMVTFNANGSAIFICAAVQLLALLNGVPLAAGDWLITWLLTTIMCFAMPSVPSASLISVVIICTTLNIPPESVGLLFAVEWFIDRLRTTSNIMSEIFGVGVTNSLVRKDLARMDQAAADGEDIFLRNNYSPVATEL